MATGPRRQQLRHEAAAAAVRCSIVLLAWQALVSPLSNSARDCRPPSAMAASDRAAGHLVATDAQTEAADLGRRIQPP
jgi:hypothetical protein